LVFGHTTKMQRKENNMANQHRIHWREWPHYVVWRIRQLFKNRKSKFVSP